MLPHLQRVTFAGVVTSTQQSHVGAPHALPVVLHFDLEADGIECDRDARCLGVDAVAHQLLHALRGGSDGDFRSQTVS